MTELTWQLNCLINEVEQLKLIIKELEERLNNIERNK